MGRIVGVTYPVNVKFTCPHCGKEYKTEDGLKKHIEKEHAKQ